MSWLIIYLVVGLVLWFAGWLFVKWADGELEDALVRLKWFTGVLILGPIALGLLFGVLAAILIILAATALLSRIWCGLQLLGAWAGLGRWIRSLELERCPNCQREVPHCLINPVFGWCLTCVDRAFARDRAYAWY